MTKEHEVQGRLETKVTRAEEMLYGSFAPLVRRMADAAVAADKAMNVAAEMLRDSREADDLSASLVKPPKLDERGYTEHTAWLEDVVYRQAWDNYSAATEAYALVARDAMERMRRWRQPAESEGRGEYAAPAGTEPDAPPVALDAKDEFERTRRRAIVDAKDADWTWTQISEAFGVSTEYAEAVVREDDAQREKDALAAR